MKICSDDLFQYVRKSAVDFWILVSLILFFLWIYFSLGKLGKLGKFFINHYLSISCVCKTFPIFRKNFRKALGKF